MKWLRLNGEVCRKKSRQLQNFKGFLPFDFMTYVSWSDRQKFLETIGLWDDVNKKNMEVKQGIRDNKPNDDVYMNVILKKWVKENPQFKDCVIEVQI